ncbi:MAG: tripartite tricarboxylate transporter substrate binding protein [Burkholderiales bacterium]
MQRILISLILSFLCCAVAHAQPYPARPINLIIPFAAGGPTDLLGRTLAAKLTDVIGQRVIVENRPGAGGSVAAEYTIRSAPDGYTIMLITVGTQTINPFVFDKIGYDPLKDFSYITTIGNYELVLLVNPNTPQKTLTELIAYGKANPDKMNFGSGGVGTTSHLAGELFSKSQGIKAQHAPYKGSAAALNDVIAGNLTFLFDVISTGAPPVDAGRVRALGVSGPKRSALLPGVPTMAEQGITGFDVTGWMGVAGPAGMPPQVIARLHQAIAESVRAPDFQQRLAQQAFEAAIISPEEFLARVKADYAKWGAVVKASGASAN